jgi:TonB-linked SusC/RagA family outer membrane protein
MSHIYSSFKGTLPSVLLAKLLLLFVFFSFDSQAQTSVVIKGKVSDAAGEGIPGATIKVQGTSIATATDVNGEYSLPTSLKAGSYSVIVSAISYTGASRSIQIGTQSLVSVDFSLKDDVMNLDEVVVTGSTVRESRRQLGNAISSVRADQIVNAGSSNLSSSLQGKIPGAQITQNSGDPAGGVTIRMRGVKSIVGSSDPLYVIDGVIVSNSSTNVSQVALSNQIGAASIGTNRLADINPMDIESINVISGGAAAAQYGSRAANGVVIITTKKGATGAPKVSFTTSISTNHLRKKVHVSEYGKQFGFAGLRLHTIGGISAAQIAANPGTTTVGIVRDGVTTQLASNLVDVNRFDYQDQIFQTGIGTENGLSISGGTERTNYFASFNYSNNEGIVKGTNFERYGLRTRIDQKLTNWAKFSVGISYTNSDAGEKANGNVFYSPINSINITNNIWDITKRDAAGDLMAVEPTRVNPLSTIEDMIFTTKVNRTINDFQLNLTPFKNFSVDWLFGVDALSQVGRGYIRPYPYQAAAGLPAERYPTGFGSTTNNVALFYNTDLNVGYFRDLTSDLKLTLLAGFSYQFSRSDYTRASGENLAPFVESLSGGAIVSAGYGLDRYNLSGYFGQATFGYKNIAFLTGAIRRDRSSKFSPDEANQLYPKLSGSVVLSDLEDWKNGTMANVLSTFKLRASWGHSGNLTGIGTYDRFWKFLPVNFLGLNTLVPDATLANPSVKPERMVETEIGADYGMFKNRVNGTFTYYNQAVQDLVVPAVRAATTGGTAIINNVGSMTNKGFEIGINADVIKKKDLVWNLGLIFNRNRSKIVKMGSNMLAINVVAGAPIYLIEGEAPSVFWGVPYARDVNGDLILNAQGLPQRDKGVQSGAYYEPQRNAEGQPSGSNVNGIIGNPNPDWTGSLTSDLKYKKLGFSFLFDAVQGVDVFNADFRTRQGVGIGEVAEQELKGDLPRGYIFANYLIDEWRVDNGSFVKLREVSLSYDLPKLGMLNNWRVSVIGRNLISFDNYRGYDPETNAGGNSDLFRGTDFGNVPIPKTFRLQLNASF